MKIYKTNLYKVLLLTMSLNISAAFAAETTQSRQVDLCPDSLLEANNYVKEIWTDKQDMEVLEKTYESCKTKSLALFEEWRKAKDFSPEQGQAATKNTDVNDFIRILGKATKKINDLYCDIQVSNILKFKSGGDLKQAFRYKVFVNYAVVEEFDSETEKSEEKLMNTILNLKASGTECVRSLF